MFAALGVKGQPELARVLEAPVPEWKLFGGPGTANGAGGTSYGLPRLASGTFLARFPFAMAVMRDRRPALEVTLTGWSPFEPGDPDGSSLPVAGLEYRIVNRGRTRLDAVFSFHARNFMGTRDKPQAIRALDGGFELWGGADKDKPWERGQLRRRRRRARHDGRSRLVPRRLVGSADADVEGGDRRRDGRAPTGHGRPAGAGRIAVRAA